MKTVREQQLEHYLKHLANIADEIKSNTDKAISAIESGDGVMGYLFLRVTQDSAKEYIALVKKTANIIILGK